jgi:hypothetical protein
MGKSIFNPCKFGPVWKSDQIRNDIVYLGPGAFFLFPIGLAHAPLLPSYWTPPQFLPLSPLFRCKKPPSGDLLLPSVPWFIAHLPRSPSAPFVHPRRRSSPVFAWTTLEHHRQHPFHRECHPLFSDRFDWRQTSLSSSLSRMTSPESSSTAAWTPPLRNAVAPPCNHHPIGVGPHRWEPAPLVMSGALAEFPLMLTMPASPPLAGRTAAGNCSTASVRGAVTGKVHAPTALISRASLDCFWCALGRPGHLWPIKRSRPRDPLGRGHGPESACCAV